MEKSQSGGDNWNDMMDAEKLEAAANPERSTLEPEQDPELAGKIDLYGTFYVKICELNLIKKNPIFRIDNCFQALSKVLKEMDTNVNDEFMENLAQKQYEILASLIYRQNINFF